MADRRRVTYTAGALLGVAVALCLDLLLARMITRRAFWVAYAIVLFFQLVVNGLLTGLRIVRYDPADILGPRLAWAPVEDLLFGFALVLVTLTLWVWLGAHARRRARPATPPPPAGRPRH